MRLMIVKDSLKGIGPAEEEALKLGAADLLQKMSLLRSLHPFAYRIHSQCRSHLHQFGQDDPAVSILVKPSHEAHVKLEQVEFDALKNIQR